MVRPFQLTDVVHISVVYLVLACHNFARAQNQARYQRLAISLADRLTCFFAPFEGTRFIAAFSTQPLPFGLLSAFRLRVIGGLVKESVVFRSHLDSRQTALITK
jgi:hypothetical protein